MERNIVYLALGSNLENPVQQICSAIQELSAENFIDLLKISSLYQTKALGDINQADFINAVVKLSTDLDPYEFLSFVQDLEAKHYRQRNVKWGPRTLDLDILFFNQDIINTDDLVVPHPEIKNRNFVLVPLYEIEPKLIFPDGASLENLINKDIFINKLASRLKLDLKYNTLHELPEE